MEKIRLHVIVECDWLKNGYEVVNPELILEDAIIDVAAGVKVYLDPAYIPHSKKGKTKN